MFGEAPGEASSNPRFNCNFHLLGKEASLPANGLGYWDVNCTLHWSWQSTQITNLSLSLAKQLYTHIAVSTDGSLEEREKDPTGSRQEGRATGRKGEKLTPA